ncbi:MAG: helix-turn-helix transcriptional regulator [Microbacterium sp.]|nr:helix-turn-helix transcriptional regulator [Microbacterium sp.]
MVSSATGKSGARFAIWLYRVRTSRGLSQEGLALRAGIAVPTYGRLERTGKGGGVSHVTLETLLRVLDALELTPQEIWALVIMLKRPEDAATDLRRARPTLG